MVSLKFINYYLWNGITKDSLFFKKLHLPVFAIQKLYFMFKEEWEFEHQ